MVSLKESEKFEGNWKNSKKSEKFERENQKESSRFFQVFSDSFLFFKDSSFRIPLDSFESFRMLLDAVRLFYILPNFFQFYSDRSRTLQKLSDPCRLF